MCLPFESKLAFTGIEPFESKYKATLFPKTVFKSDVAIAPVAKIFAFGVDI